MGTGSPEMTSACIQLQRTGLILGESALALRHGISKVKQDGEICSHQNSHLDFSVN